MGGVSAIAENGQITEKFHLTELFSLYMVFSAIAENNH
jgi:hypothetical protein